MDSGHNSFFFVGVQQQNKKRSAFLLLSMGHAVPLNIYFGSPAAKVVVSLG
jgi:hypothetical protein